MKQFISRSIFDIRSIIRELWIIAFIFSFLALLIHNYINFESVLLSIGIAIGYGLAFALNDYYDREYDRINPEKAERNFFVRSGFSKNIAFFLIISILIILTLIFGQFGIRGLLLLSLSISVLWAYSAPPIRFKSQLILDLVIPAIFMHAYPYALTILTLKLEIKPIDIGIISLLIFSSIGSQIEQQVRDFKYDVVSDTNTTQLLGKVWAIRLMQFFSLVMVIDFFILIYLQILPNFLILLALIYLVFIVERFTSPATGKNENLSRIATIITFLYLLTYSLMF